MNTDDGTSLDEQISSILAACDDAMAAGASPTLTFSNEVPPEVKERIDRGLRSVTLLRRRLPSVGQFTLSPPPEPSGPPPADVPFSRLGRFLIRRELGRGAHGLVFLAHDPTLRRDVALKVPRAEALVSPDLRERFVREARAAAALDHPNLVPVYEAGEAGPVCYIASAYCPGPTLGQWLKDHDGPVSARVAAALLAGLASAAHHAHQRGVVHRDLKPGNVLLTPLGGPHEGGPGFVPKVTDFGLAKILAEGEASQTRTGTVMGSPSYMAPEQAGGKSLEAGAAADVYSLGAILYECLTGRPPFKAATVLATLDLVRSADPVPPRSLNPQVPTDLETVCLKCLHKEPSRRYASARELEEDLGRFLAGTPVVARPVPAWEHVVRWARRRPGVAALIGVLVVGAAVAFAVVFGLWRYAQAKATDEATARGEAEQGRRSVRAQLARADLKLGLSLCRQEDTAGLLWLARGLENAAAAEDPALEALLRTQVAAWLPEAHTLRDCRRLPAPVRAVALTPDARLCLAGCEDGTAHLWESATGRALGSPLTHPAPVEAVALSPDGKVGGHGVRRRSSADLGRGRGQSREHRAGLDRGPRHPALGLFEPGLPAGRRRGPGLLGTGGECRHLGGTGGEAGRRIPVAEWSALPRVRQGPGQPRLRGRARAGTKCSGVGAASRQHRGPPGDHRFHGRGLQPRRHAGSDRDRRGGSTGGVGSTLGGGRVATGGGDNTLCLWDLATSTLIGPPLRHPDEINRLAFRPDGRVIATRCRGPAVVHLWPVPSPLSGDPARIIRAVEVRTGLKLGADETVRVLDAEEWLSLRTTAAGL